MGARRTPSRRPPECAAATWLTTTRTVMGLSTAKMHAPTTLPRRSPATVDVESWRWTLSTTQGTRRQSAGRSMPASCRPGRSGQRVPSSFAGTGCDPGRGPLPWQGQVAPRPAQSPCTMSKTATSSPVRVRVPRGRCPVCWRPSLVCMPSCACHARAYPTLPPHCVTLHMVCVVHSARGLRGQRVDCVVDL